MRLVQPQRGGGTLHGVAGVFARLQRGMVQHGLGQDQLATGRNHRRIVAGDERLP